jgi:hypothetical protein
MPTTAICHISVVRTSVSSSLATCPLVMLIIIFSRPSSIIKDDCLNLIESPTLLIWLLPPPPTTAALSPARPPYYAIVVAIGLAQPKDRANRMHRDHGEPLRCIYILQWAHLGCVCMGVLIWMGDGRPHCIYVWCAGKGGQSGHRNEYSLQILDEHVCLNQSDGAARTVAVHTCYLLS